MMKHKHVSIKSVLSQHLALRDNADYLFDMIEKGAVEDAAQAPMIIIDFSEIRSISRSFAHQYLIRKKESSKNVREVNIPKVVQRMFDAVTKTIQNDDTSSRRPVLKDLDSIQEQVLSLNNT